MAERSSRLVRVWGGIARALLLAVTVVGSGAVAAGDWLVVDLVGHQLTMVRSVPITTGSNVDRNEQQVLAVADDVLSGAVVRAASDAIRSADPEARVHELSLSAPERAMLLPSGDGKSDVDVARLVALVAGKLPAAARMVVVVPYRAEFRLHATVGNAEMSIGHGKAAGLGYYIDRSMPLTITGSSEQGRGFLGIFAHARIIVLQASGGARLAEESFAAGTTVAAGRTPDENPWQALSNDEKISRLAGVCRTEIGRVVPPLVRGVVAARKANGEKK